MNVVDKKEEKRLGMKKMWVVKVACSGGICKHKQRNLKSFFGTLNRSNPYSCTKTRHPIIVFNSYFWSAENIRQQNFLLTFTSLLHRASYQVRQLTKIPITRSQKQETLMGRASPTQLHGSFKPMHVRFWSLQSHLRILGGMESNWSSLTFKC
jgi:hypothetical protein